MYKQMYKQQGWRAKHCKVNCVGVVYGIKLKTRACNEHASIKYQHKVLLI